MNAALTTAIGEDGPSAGLRAALILRRMAGRLEAKHVNEARRVGWTWAEIGDAFGVTRQAVHKKYRKGL